MIELWQRLGRVPRYCVWELTLACNMRCQHCGSFAGTPRDDELSPAELLSIADQLTEMGCEKVTLSGGEPTLCPTWPEVGRRLSDRGVRVNIISNGWSWSEIELDRARDAGLRDVAFSLDGLLASHDRVRRAGSFDRVVEAVTLCVAGGIPTSVITLMNQLNKNELGVLRAKLADLGVTVWQVQLGNPSGEMSKRRETVIPPEDLLWLVPELAALCRDGGRPAVRVAENVGYYGKYETAIRGSRDPRIPVWIGCSAGWQSLGIESNGNLKGCLSLPSSRHGHDRFVEGNLRERRLDAIWNDDSAFAFNRGLDAGQLAGFCGRCRYRDICRAGCIWTAFSHTGSRYDNPYCFYRQAVAKGRYDLLDEEPTAEEIAAGGSLS